MAQIPSSLRRRSTPDSTQTLSLGSRLSGLGSWLLIVAALIGCILGVWGVVHRLRHAPVAEVIITGDLTAPEEQALQASIQPLVHENYFTADLVRIRDTALRQSWVASVTVTRHWPDGLLIRVIPRQPIARWGSGRLLSGDGAIFSDAGQHDHPELPLLHGPVSQSMVIMQQFQRINQWFAPLGIRLNELYLTDRMTWFMAFDTGLRVIVDQEQTNLKLQRLSDLGQRDDKLRELWPRIAAVDLRYRNGMAIQWGAARPLSIAATSNTLSSPAASPVAVPPAVQPIGQAPGQTPAAPQSTTGGAAL